MPKILLADDSTHAQRMGTKILSAEGYEVSTVSNGKAAIDSFKKSIPDLIVADVFMPGRNGYEVCQHVKTTEGLKHIPVLLIIGAMEPYDPDEGKKAGADGVITKPLESSNLVTTIKALLEAAKHFAPAKPAPKKETAKKAEEATMGPDPYAPVVEDPAWAAHEEEIITSNPRQEEIVIPQAISQQPVGMLTDLLDPVETPEPAAAEPPLPELENPGMEIPVSSPPQSLAEVFPPMETPAEAPEEAPAEAPSSTPRWVAQPAEVSAEDEKLFESPAAPANWSDLTQLAAAVSEDPPPSNPLPWATEPDLIRPDTTEVATGTAEGIEHFENLNETISSHAPISMSAMGIGIQSISMASPEPVEAADPAMPSYDDEIILSPADMSAGAVADATPTDPELERGFEPITATVPLNLQLGEEMNAPAVEAVAQIEQAAAPVAEAAVVAKAPAATPDPLVEAAVAMVREATQRELAAEAAASPDAATPAVDPSTLEHVIRGVVGELMPQIVAQVKSALKH